MKNLKKQLIRLGDTHPDLRDHLRPVLDSLKVSGLSSLERNVSDTFWDYATGVGLPQDRAITETAKDLALNEEDVLEILKDTGVDLERRLGSFKRKGSFNGDKAVAGRVYVNDAPLVKVQFAILLSLPVGSSKIRDVTMKVDKLRESLTKGIERETGVKVYLRGTEVRIQSSNVLRFVTTLTLAKTERATDPDFIESLKGSLQFSAGVTGEIEVIE